MARLGIALGLIIALAAPAVTAGPPLSLTASTDKTQYALDETIVLTLRLENIGTEPTTVTEATEGTYRVRVTRDGRRVRPERLLIRFSDDPLVDQVEALRTLQPTESVDVRHDVGRASPTGAEILEIRLAKASRKFHQARASTMTVPGVYTVRLEYRYRGDDGGLPNVFRHRLRSNTVTFTLVAAP